MGLFSKTKQKDKLLKYFNENKISVDKKNDKLAIDFIPQNQDYTLHPYFVVDDENDSFSIIINIKKIDKINIDIYKKINDFNLSSKYFVMKISNDNIIYLEYNSLIDDNAVDVFIEVIDSINNLGNAINNI